jgi:hypothetical protein
MAARHLKLHGLEIDLDLGLPRKVIEVTTG